MFSGIRRLWVGLGIIGLMVAGGISAAPAQTGSPQSGWFTQAGAPSTGQTRGQARQRGSRGRRARIRKWLLQKFDTNGDGKLDPSERQAARRYLQQMRQRRGQGGRGQGRSARIRQWLLQKFDANRDGKLEPSERRAARQYLQQMRQRRGQGGRSQQQGGQN